MCQIDPKFQAHRGGNYLPKPYCMHDRPVKPSFNTLPGYAPRTAVYTPDLGTHTWHWYPWHLFTPGPGVPLACAAKRAESAFRNSVGPADSERPPPPGSESDNPVLSQEGVPAASPPAALIGQIQSDPQGLCEQSAPVCQHQDPVPCPDSWVAPRLSVWQRHRWRRRTRWCRLPWSEARRRTRRDGTGEVLLGAGRGEGAGDWRRDHLLCPATGKQREGGTFCFCFSVFIFFKTGRREEGGTARNRPTFLPCPTSLLFISTPSVLIPPNRPPDGPSSMTLGTHFNNQGSVRVSLKKKTETEQHSPW